jgi:hypothetical protein
MAAFPDEAYHRRNASEAVLPRKSVLWLVALALIAMAAAYLARGQIALAQIGTAFAAKQTCSCLFVSRRQLDSCKLDFDRAETRMLSWRVESRSVTVSVLLLFSATAEFEEGFGCRLLR